jgi:hypothetical protein
MIQRVERLRWDSFEKQLFQNAIADLAAPARMGDVTTLD